MRGRPNDPAKARAKARAHAKRAHHCSCGQIVHGNGGKASHAAMHERNGDGWIRDMRPEGHHYISREQHRTKFPEQYTHEA